MRQMLFHVGSLVSIFGLIAMVLWHEHYPTHQIILGALAITAIFFTMAHTGPKIQQWTGRSAVWNARVDIAYYIISLLGIAPFLLYFPDSGIAISMVVVGSAMTVGRIVGQLFFGDRHSTVSDMD
ncbi:hypothetical protein [Rhodopirellula baltica]|nr:hypothetical protein [Rhodopirellula baltica]